MDGSESFLSLGLGPIFSPKDVMRNALGVEKRQEILLLMENGMRWVNSKKKLDSKNKCHW